MEWDLIYRARNLAVADKRKPRQANLRRAASSIPLLYINPFSKHNYIECHTVSGGPNVPYPPCLLRRIGDRRMKDILQEGYQRLRSDMDG